MSWWFCRNFATVMWLKLTAATGEAQQSAIADTAVSQLTSCPPTGLFLLPACILHILACLLSAASFLFLYLFAVSLFAPMRRSMPLFLTPALLSMYRLGSTICHSAGHNGRSSIPHPI
ncbi:hypothetical protein BO83DRAFT_23416 [Aspergillus eucalypticola CBS 122712]|uniref:Uncharacterized protein n=1 Tax=Aspergillus eucalypticola (strain CBS 122712 / IBT 29274) TaxID=1448314 RepID=A0A317VI03_ASPEC|nr:uncharacterized protein BO83DRAFT_23416 [Aspergillus eucalypticola CBS 122712]PWY74014.1 hypothetical protein BO83DRAFT_23416 [Aspergillus eucalypticola CBS 122712]